MKKVALSYNLDTSFKMYSKSSLLEVFGVTVSFIINVLPINNQVFNLNKHYPILTFVGKAKSLTIVKDLHLGKKVLARSQRYSLLWWNIYDEVKVFYNIDSRW